MKARTYALTYSPQVEGITPAVGDNGLSHGSNPRRHPGRPVLPSACHIESREETTKP